MNELANLHSAALRAELYGFSGLAAALRVMLARAVAASPQPGK